MAQIKNLIAKWGAAWPSPMIISRQYDNGQYRIDLFNYPEPEHIVDEQTEQMEVLSYYLIVWMKETEDGEPREMSPIQLPGPYWIVPNYYTQLVQDIRFQFCVQSDSTDYEAHSAIFTGRIVDSIEHDGTVIDVIPVEMFDAYKAYIQEIAMAAGAVVIDPNLDTAGAAADAKAVGDALSSTNERLLNAFPVNTASGSVVTFDDGADGVPLKSLVVNINPVQSGSGDPSPDNVRPISGWSVVNVGVSGKNLFDSNFSNYTKPYDYYIRPIKLESDKRYVIKAELVGTVVTGAVFGITKKGDKYSEFLPYVVVASSGTVASFEFTADGTFTSPKLIVYASGQAKFDEVMSNYNITFEVKADQNPYEPYKGTFHTIPLGQTVYGGTLDVLSGELVIDRAMRTLTGADDWVLDSDGTSRDGVTCLRAYQEMSALKKPVGNEGNRTYIEVIIASNLPTVKNGYVNQLNMDGIDIAITGYAGDKGNYLYIIVNKSTMSIRTVADLKAWLAENNVQFCYELATPITVTLTPNELSTLLGANNIWSDAGEVTAEYRADPTLFIQRKIAEAISALS